MSNRPTHPLFNPLDYRASFSRPELVVPSAWSVHVPFAMSCVELLEPRTIVELGVHNGTSYCAFCQAVDLLGLDTRCHGIDTWEGDPQSGHYGPEVLTDLQAYHDPKYGHFSTLMKMSFDAAVGHFGDGTIDLLHIDGSHTYEDVENDWKTWSPKLSSRGVALFHDINARERDFGVWRLWEQLAPKHPHFEFSFAYGLGVLAVGAEVPEIMLDLCHLDAAQRSRVQALFYNLGNANRWQAYAASAKELETALLARDADLARGRKELSRALEKHASSEALLGEQKERTALELEAGRFELADLRSRMEELREVNRGQAARVEELVADIAARTRARQQAEDAHTAAREEIERRAEQLAVAHAERDRIAENLRAKEEDLAERAKITAALEQAITEMRSRLETVHARELEAIREAHLRKIASLQQEIEERGAELERVIEDLRAELATAEGGLANRENRVEEAYRELASVATELTALRGSKAWKVTAPLRLARTMVVEAIRGVRRKTVRMAFGPLNEIALLGEASEYGDSEYESLGVDPQFVLLSDSRRLPRGLQVVRGKIEALDEFVATPCLYVDTGAGFNENQRIELRVDPQGIIDQLVQLPGNMVSIRFDPGDCVGRFRVEPFTFKAISAAEVRLRERIPQQKEHHGGSVSTSGARTPKKPSRQPIDLYSAWQRLNGWTERREGVLRRRLAELESEPLLSVVMPVYNPKPEFLERAITSVVDQVYENWELCIADDASTDPKVAPLLDDWAERDSRIRMVFREENGNISRATNTAAEMAKGEFIVLMDNDDELTPDALGEVALAVAKHADVDIVYSDDDKIDEAGKRLAPQFKPDWSPELLLSYMYLSHLFVLRTDLYREVGGLRVGFEGSQDYDLALRASEKARRVLHVPKILYHWRVAAGSTAKSGAAKPASFEAGRRAVQEALDRRGVEAQVFRPQWAVAAACGIFGHTFADGGPMVTIIIPTKNNVEVLRRCLESLKKTTYRNYEVVIIDNETDDPASIRFLDGVPHRVLKLGNREGGFNFAAINNEAVEAIDSELVLFLNNDVEIVNASWLGQMVGYASIPGVGVVGARLEFPDGRIQHAGIVHGYYHGMAGPAFKLLPTGDPGYLAYTLVARNCSAVTAAAMLTTRKLFREHGGFDTNTFGVAYNDVDFCYRVVDAGERVVFVPDAQLVHHEGYSRGMSDNPDEVAAFRAKYRNRMDPYYSPNLSLDDERFAINPTTVAAPIREPIPTLVCSHSLNLEGAPNSQMELTVSLRDRGVIRPIVYCPSEGPLRRQYEDRGIDVFVSKHPLGGVASGSQYAAAIAELVERFKGWGVELVYANTMQTFWAIEAAHASGLPSIWNPRESEPWQSHVAHFGQEVVRHVESCFGYPYRVVFVADATKQLYKDVSHAGNFTTVHNGLNTERLKQALSRVSRSEARSSLGIDAADLVVLTIGTICERKGQLDLIAAAQLIGRRNGRRTHFVLVGDRQGDYSRRLHASHTNLEPSLRSRVHVIPETHDVAQYYSAADVFACTSLRESYPRVILEAMYCGLPIVTTPVNGIREQVREGVNAVFYDAGDSGGLARSLEAVLADEGRREEMADASPRVLAGLRDHDEMVAQYERLFCEAWTTG